MNDGTLQNDEATREAIDIVLRTRGTLGSTRDDLDGRMPLAYAHLVQMLVDAFLLLRLLLCIQSVVNLGPFQQLAC